MALLEKLKVERVSSSFRWLTVSNALEKSIKVKIVSSLDLMALWQVSLICKRVVVVLWPFRHPERVDGRQLEVSI